MVKKPKSPAPAAQASSSISRSVCVLGLAIVAVFVLASVVVGRLDSGAQNVLGRVVDTRTEQAFTGRKSVGNREVQVVKFTINDKERVVEVAPPSGSSYSHSFVHVYYYPAFPWYTWYHNKENGILWLCISAAVIGGLIAGYSGYRLLRRRPAAKRR